MAQCMPGEITASVSASPLLLRMALERAARADNQQDKRNGAKAVFGVGK